MWLQDMRDGTALVVSNQERQAIRGTSPGSTEERELGWLGWSLLRDISADGTKIVFDEEADGGGPNYTAFMRDTDGSPPVRISDGVALAISPDNQWVITRSAQGGPLRLVPTGAGDAPNLPTIRSATRMFVTSRMESACWRPASNRAIARAIT